ncbi:MAG: hypothetical protein ACOYNI_08760 [Acidimicrobiia bacterium]
MTADVTSMREAADQAFDQGLFETARLGYLRAAVAQGKPSAEQLIEVLVADRLAADSDRAHPTAEQAGMREQKSFAAAVRALAKGAPQPQEDLRRLGYAGGVIEPDEKRTAELIATGDWLAAAAERSALSDQVRAEVLTALVEVGQVEPSRAYEAMKKANRVAPQVALAFYRYAAEAYTLAEQPGFAAMAVAQHARQLELAASRASVGVAATELGGR